MLSISPYLLTPILGWIAAQGVKYAIAMIKTRDRGTFRSIYLSGGMPSSHSSTVVSLAVFIGLFHGVESALFGISALLAAVVMYDAVMVRRSVGEQGQAIHELIAKTLTGVRLPHAAKGHTPLEVLMGGVVGTAVGLVVFLATI
ncbi:MAG: divergent PAP2 family protein [bacterium]|nr:divergent PAP2 family protein [bacterium]